MKKTNNFPVGFYIIAFVIILAASAVYATCDPDATEYVANDCGWDFGGFSFTGHVHDRGGWPDCHSRSNGSSCTGAGWDDSDWDPCAWCETGTPGANGCDDGPPPSPIYIVTWDGQCKDGICEPTGPLNYTVWTGGAVKPC